MTIQNKTIYLTPKYDYLFSDVEGAKNRFDYKKDKLINCKIKARGKRKKQTCFVKIVGSELNQFTIIEDCTFFASKEISHCIESTFNGGIIEQG
jgi:hypothetical protein